MLQKTTLKVLPASPVKEIDRVFCWREGDICLNGWEDAWKWALSMIFGAGSIYGAMRTKMRHHSEAIKRLDERDALQDRELKAELTTIRAHCDKEHARCNEELYRRFDALHKRMAEYESRQVQISDDTSYMRGVLEQVVRRGKHYE